MKFLSYLLVAVLALGGGIALEKFVLKGQMGNLNSLLNTTGTQPEATSTEKKPLYWVAPMDKNYRRDKPGKSPMGMDLVPVYEEDNAGTEGGVKISPTVVNNLGVRTAKVKKGQIVLPIETVGYIHFDEDRLNHIHSRVDGWIEVLNVKSSGDPVKKGQTLYELYSPSLVNAQEEYLAALRSRNTLLQSASESRLLSLGVNKSLIRDLQKRRKVQQRISILAESNGIVEQLNVREGMFIKPATEVMSVGSLSSVWVIAEVFERQAGWVHPGQKVILRSEAYPDTTWEGNVDYLYPVLDSKTRTLKVRVKVDNQDGRLKPNMYTNLTIETEVAKDSLSIPREALIKAGDHTRVVKVLAEGDYKSVIVKPGVEFDHQVQILDGLSAGDKVVTSAQFLIDSESNIDAELARLQNPEKPADAQKDSANSVMATGTVKGVMKDMNMLSINHDPIPEWDWPSMKMDFNVDASVKLDGISAGDKVRFELKKTGEWDYLVTKLVDDKAENTSASSTTTSTKSVHAKGKVKNLMLDMAMIEVVHDPIPAWQWPTMSMAFTVPETQSVPKLNPGDMIDFTLTETEDGEYLITEIKKTKPKR